LAKHTDKCGTADVFSFIQIRWKSKRQKALLGYKKLSSKVKELCPAWEFNASDICADLLAEQFAVLMIARSGKRKLSFADFVRF
jgi:hypothetical protein